ncbi:MAG: PAS domain S-box protein, partial [Candidatus Hodarchaeota archaeon]
NLTFANRFGLALFGYTQEELDQGVNILQLFAPEDRERLLANFQRKLTGEMLGEEGRHYRALRKNSSSFPAYIYTNPVYDQDNKPTGLRGILIDNTQQKEAEAALRESEEKYRSLIETSPDGITLTELDGTISIINRQGAKILGYEEPSELVGKNAFDFVAPEDQTRARENLQKTLSKRSISNVEYRGIRKDGTIFFAAISTTVILDEEGIPKHFMGITRDVTDRKQVEHELQQSEERFRTLVENIPIGLSRTTPGPKGEFLMANPAFLDLFGFESEEEIKQISVADIYTNPNERVGFSNNLLTQGGISRGEFQYKKKDGTPIWGAITARVVHEADEESFYFDCTIEDITERKNAEIALRDSEEKYRTLVERANDGILIIQDGIIKFINQQMETMFGRNVREILNTPYSDYIPPDQMEKLAELFERRIAGEDFPKIYETFALNLDGSRRPIEINAGIIKYEDRPADLVIVRDISERKEKEAVLLQYRSLVETSPDGIALTEPDGTISFINQRGTEILGYEHSEELIGKSTFDFISPEDRARVMENLQRTLNAGAVSTIEYSGVKKDGTLFAASISANVITDEEGKPKYLIGITRDITDRKRVEQELRESEERYRNILDTIEEGYFEVDLKGSFTFFNDSIPEILGYQEYELMGMNYRHYMDPKAAEKVFSTFNTLFKTREPAKLFDWEITRRDGDKKCVEASISLIIDSTGDPIGFRGIVRDITERKWADEALRESEERYRELVEKMLEGMVVEDSEGILTFINPRAARMLGYTQEELIGQHWSAVVPDHERERVQEEVARRPQGISSTYETLLLRKNGQAVPVIVNATPLFSAEKAFRGVLAVFTEITERKQAEEELRKQKEELSHFARAMAHDLRNSLHGIQGFAKLLAKKYDKSYTEKIINYTNKMTDLLRRSVDLADAGLVVEKTDSIDLNPLVRNVADSTIPESIQFEHDVLPTVVGDRVKVVQIFQNLFENAVLHAEPDKIRVKRNDSDEGCHILIINDGKPIPSDYRSDIFARDFSVQKDGRGIGMTIISRLVEAHGWQIFLEEDTAETTFHIIIPTGDYLGHRKGIEVIWHKP